MDRPRHRGGVVGVRRYVGEGGGGLGRSRSISDRVRCVKMYSGPSSKFIANQIAIAIANLYFLPIGFCSCVINIFQLFAALKCVVADIFSTA